MNLETFIALAGPKYIIVTAAVHEADELAKSIAPEPRKFVLGETDYVAINVEPVALPDLAAYIGQQAGIEFEFVQGSGNAALLTQSQVLDLIAAAEPTEQETD